MSLLLDALKKAADDKEKNKQKSVVAEQAVENPDNTQDLDLDLVSEEYPLVDDNFISEHGAEDENQDLNTTQNQPGDTNTISHDLEQGEHAGAAEMSEPTQLTADKLNDEKLKQNIQDGSAEAVNLTLEKQAPGESRIADRRKSEPSKFDRTVQYDPEALQVLINKSNRNSRSAKLRNTYLVAMAIMLLLVLAGGYFALEVSRSTESIYVADANVANENKVMQPVTDKNPAAIEAGAPVEEKKPLPARSVVAKPKAVARASVVADKNTDVKAFTIIHKKTDDPIDVLLQKAYAAFNAGDYALAKKHYQSVLDKEERNKDAMLGVAAVAVKEQRLDYARQKYMQILYLDPKDTYAKAGLNAIETQQESAYSESQLKMMLREQPDAAHLHFSLGSLYATQEKWPEAQSAFFNAWSLEGNNSDYAFNLAVSLDHMDKRKQAIELYELSLKLYQASNSNFDKENVLSRIKALNNAGKESN